jgi:hypothetical protein
MTTLIEATPSYAQDATKPVRRNVRIAHTTRRLRVMFVHTNMPVGGAETLTVELIRRLDRRRFAPELCCL